MNNLQLIPFIMMNGKAQEAIEFYQQAFNAKLLFKQTYRQGPPNEVSKIAENELDLIAHAVLKIDQADIMLADIIHTLPFQQGTQVSICITNEDAARSKQIFETLREGGKVIVDLNPTYYSPAYGMLTDKFGVVFQIFTTRKETKI